MKIDEIRKRSLEYAKGLGPAAKIEDSEVRITRRWLAQKLKQVRRVNTRTIRLAEMGLNYQQYIKSQAWRKFRADYIARHGERCQVVSCGNTGSILHHRNYDNLGFERDRDVAFICTPCHDWIHDHIRKSKWR